MKAEKVHEIIQIGDPVLRTPARSLSVEEILSPEIQELIREMRTTLYAAEGVGLAAPQIGKPLQLIVIEDIEHGHLTPQQLVERERFPVPFHVIINPQLTLHEDEKAEFFEGCLSIPGMVGVVPRARSVTVECLDEAGQPRRIEARGWYARILQHEIDHLCGVVFLDRAHLRTVMTNGNFIALWKEKSVAEVKKAL